MIDISDFVIPEYVNDLLCALENSGYEAYLVGGCVRDRLIGIEPNDYDITTSALPNEIEEALSDYKIIRTGLKHGTLTVISDDHQVEITTFRFDGEYSDNRHPDSVVFTKNLKDDLSRRDFSINAMAYSKKSGLIDLFDGCNCLTKKIIKTVGNPDKRFSEDALRILRALRFAAVYNFDIDKETADSIHRNKLLVNNISGERIATELNRLICAECADILREFYDVFAVIIPEINMCHGFLQHSKYHDKDVYEHITATVCAVCPKPYMRLTMLFHDLGKPQCYKYENGAGHFKGHAAVSAEIAARVLSDLKYDNDTKEKVLFLVKRHDMPLTNDRTLLKHYLSKFGSELLFDLIDIHIADDLGKAKEYQSRIETYKAIRTTISEILNEKPCLTLHSLEINGNDIMQMGIYGKKIGEALNLLLCAVIDEKCLNTRKDLLKYLEENVKK